MKKVVGLLLSAALLTASSMGCSWRGRVAGGVIGTGAGGPAGGVVGHHFGNTALGAIIGAAVGGDAGALIGNEMDKRADEMRRDMLGATIERVGEGIRITFDSGLLFDVDRSDLQPLAHMKLHSLAAILRKYSDTNIFVEGDTNNSGSDAYNMELSERRAQSVAAYLMTLGVSGARISTVGLGELNPVAANTGAGRAQNRRVEVAIFANDMMKASAQSGTLN